MGEFYKVYVNYNGLDKLGVVGNPKGAYNLILNCYCESALYLVIKRDTELEMDSVYKLIKNEKDMEKFKQEVYPINGNKHKNKRI